MISCMIDIETLGDRQDACILSVAAIVFDRHSVDVHYADSTHVMNSFVSSGSPFYQVVQPQLDRHADPNTVLWWLEQSDEARSEITKKEKAPLGDVLNALGLFYSQWKCEEVWSHGLSFDLIILNHAYQQYGIKRPWHYRDMRDTRTVFSLLSKEQQEQCWPDNPKKHNPVYDAAAQTAALLKALRLLSA